MEVEDLLRGRPPETIERRHRLIDPRHRAPVSLGRECHNTARRVPREADTCVRLRALRAPFQRRPRAVCRTTRAAGRGEMPAKVMLRAPGRMAVLLLEEPAISLRAAVPTARLHARRLAQPAIGQAGRYRRPVEALFARGDTNLLFTTATHRRGKSRRGREQGNEIETSAVIRRRSVHRANDPWSCRCPREALADRNSRVCVACPSGLRLIRTLQSSWPDLSGHPCL